MHPAQYAAMSDPVLNPQFRRHWRPPDPQKRERRPTCHGTALESQTQQNHDETTAERRNRARVVRAA
jgi:hypothetical protein